MAVAAATDSHQIASGMLMEYLQHGLLEYLLQGVWLWSGSGTWMEYQQRGPFHCHWASLFRPWAASRCICDSMKQTVLLPCRGRSSPSKFVIVIDCQGLPVLSEFTSGVGTAIVCHSVALHAASTVAVWCPQWQPVSAIRAFETQVALATAVTHIQFTYTHKQFFVFFIRSAGFICSHPCLQR